MSNYAYLLASFSPLICILESFMSEMDQKLAFGEESSQFPQSIKHHRSKEEWQWHFYNLVGTANVVQESKHLTSNFKRSLGGLKKPQDFGLSWKTFQVG